MRSILKLCQCSMPHFISTSCHWLAKIVPKFAFLIFLIIFGRQNHRRVLSLSVKRTFLIRGVKIRKLQRLCILIVDLKCLQRFWHLIIFLWFQSSFICFHEVSIVEYSFINFLLLVVSWLNINFGPLIQNVERVFQLFYILQWLSRYHWLALFRLLMCRWRAIVLANMY